MFFLGDICIDVSGKNLEYLDKIIKCTYRKHTPDGNLVYELYFIKPIDHNINLLLYILPLGVTCTA